MEQRMEFAVKALSSENFCALCREYGISTKTGYKWRERFLEHGRAGLEEQSRRPHRHPDELGEAVICEMVRLKQAHPHWGPRKIQASTPASTAQRAPVKAASSGCWHGRG